MESGTIWALAISGVVALGTLAAAIAALLQLRSDSLRRAERLAALAPLMKLRSAERQLIEKERDAAAVAWVLRVTAPRYSWMRIWAWSLLLLGLFTMVGTGLLQFFVDEFDAPWAYWVGLLLYLGGGALSVWRTERRSEWRTAKLREHRLQHYDPNGTPTSVTRPAGPAR